MWERHLLEPVAVLGLTRNAAGSCKASSGWRLASLDRHNFVRWCIFKTSWGPFDRNWTSNSVVGTGKTHLLHHRIAADGDVLSGLGCGDLFSSHNNLWGRHYHDCTWIMNEQSLRKNICKHTTDTWAKCISNSTFYTLFSLILSPRLQSMNILTVILWTWPRAGELTAAVCLAVAWPPSLSPFPWLGTCGSRASFQSTSPELSDPQEGTLKDMLTQEKRCWGHPLNWWDPGGTKLQRAVW